MRGDGEPFHSFLPVVFYIHFAAIAILAVLTVYSLVLHPVVIADENSNRVSGPEKAGRRNLVLILMASVCAVYFLSGILDARLTPVIPAAPSTALHIILNLLAVIAAPVAGWLLDKRPERLFRHILPVCCWLFILAPSLAALGYMHSLHAALQPVMSAAQFVFFVVCSVGLARLAPDAGTAVWYAYCVYALRMATIAGHLVWTRVFGFGIGITILAATFLALLASSLIRRVNFAIVPDEEILDRAAEPESLPVAMVQTDDGVDAFLAKGRLMPREMETGVLLLGGKAGAEIAEALEISERTVKRHAANIYRKFEVANRRELYRLFTEFSVTQAKAAEAGSTGSSIGI